MIRKLLATTALVALMAGPAVAASASDPSTPASGLTMESFGTLDAAEVNGYLASNFIGHSVYASATEDAERIGEVNDALIGRDGVIKAVILGVGGFLGVGEKDVAVDFGRLTVEKSGEGEYRLVSALSKEELENAAAYRTPDKASMNTGDKASAEAMAKKEPTAATLPKGSTVADVTAEATTTAKTPENSRASFMEDKTKLTSEQIEAEKLVGAWAYDSNFNHIGEVGDVLVTADGKLDAMIIDVGGFLGLGEKPVAMSFKQVDLYRDDGDSLFATVPYTEKQLKAASAYEAKAFATRSDKMLLTPAPIN
ncbi:MAG: PRC-barrel domain-containing protein [Thalassobaculaceae bacterium]|nr:PRC-barrel domain-containing protein [Thalassobaculaceae bacterium]